MKIIAKKKRIEKSIPFVVGETYLTKMATGEKFTITSIEYKIKNEIEVIRCILGTYASSPNLTDCPISPERLTPKIEVLNEEITEHSCPHCKEIITL